MRSILRRLVNSAGSEWVLQRLHGRKCRILTYHRFGEESRANFERQCAYLRRHYSPLSLDAYVDALREGRPTPAGSVVLTIDDGYRDVYEHAAPILRRFEIPATVAVVSGFLDRRCWLWWDYLTYAFLDTPLREVTLDLPGQDTAVYSLAGETQRRQAAAAVSFGLLRADNDAIMEHVAAVAGRLDVEVPAEPVSAYAPMSWEQARELTRHGITIASHTVNHKVVGTLRSYDSKRFEIFESKRRIEEMLQQPVRHFCFPNGGIGDYSHIDVQLVREAGYESGLTTFLGMQHDRLDVHQLPRINAGAEMDLDFFRLKVAGLFHHAGSLNLPTRGQN